MSKTPRSAQPAPSTRSKPVAAPPQAGALPIHRGFQSSEPQPPQGNEQGNQQGNQQGSRQGSRQGEGPERDERRATARAELLRAQSRRRFIHYAATGTTLTVFGGVAALLSRDWRHEARANPRADARPRVPPGQRVLGALKPMGGEAGPAGARAFRLRVHGLVRQPFELDFVALLALPQTELRVDVHCVTGWSLLDLPIRGVLLRDLARRAGVQPAARHVIFEAAHGYTSNVRLREALADNVCVAHTLAGQPLATPHGAPVRAVVPDLYFWKSAKWLQGIRFVEQDEPGYWEQRGYHNHADPWREERYA